MTTGLRRPRTWVDINIDENLTSGSSFIKDLLVNAVVDLQTKSIIRWIGRLLVIPSTVANSTVSAQLVSLGIGIVSRDGFAVAGGVPNPQTATDFPITGWVIRDQAVLVNQQDSGTVEAWHFPEFRFDIRAARKVDRGIAMLHVAQVDLIAGTTAVKIAGLVRCLQLG